MRRAGDKPSRHPARPSKDWNLLAEGGQPRMSDNKLKVYRDVWQRLYDEVLNEKTSWGKEELKKRMDKMLIEEMEKYL